MHILIREAAYHGLLKRTRADLHVRFIDWLERVAPDRVLEFEEIRGYHLEQAFFTLQQLTPNDEQVWQIGVRGSGYLSSAGRRALARGDIPAAANLLRRAASLLPPGHPERPRLRLDAAEALAEQGGFAEAEALHRAAIEEAHELSDRVLEATARIQEMELRYTIDPGGGRGDGRRRGRGAPPRARDPRSARRSGARMAPDHVRARDGAAVGRVGGRRADHPGPREARGEQTDGREGDPLARLLRPQRADARPRGDRSLPGSARRGQRRSQAGRFARGCAIAPRGDARERGGVASASTGRAGRCWRSWVGPSSPRRRRSIRDPWRCSRATWQPPRRSSGATTTRWSGWVRRTTSRRRPRCWPRCCTGRETSRGRRTTRGSAKNWQPRTTCRRSSAGGACARRSWPLAARDPRPRSSRAKPSR